MSHDALIDALSCTIETRDDGAVIYRNAEGQPHRIHGPAVIHPDGAERWYQNGVLHRLDGPAVVYYSGTKRWYQNGLLHRTDGAAIVYPDGDQRWFLNGEEVSEEDFCMRVAAGDYREP